MKRIFPLLLACLIFAAMLVTACGSPLAQAKAPDLTSTPTPIEEETVDTPVVVSHGGPVEDYVSLIDNLRASGATVEPVGEVEQAFFSVKGWIINVNGADVQVFEYADTAAAAAAAALVAPDGGSVGTTMVTWVETPHFYKLGKLIVLYVGTDAAVTTLLEKAFGPQFAGG